MPEATLHTYTVTGMSCAHCRSSVLEEVGELEGVETVEVDLESGALRVTGHLVDESEIARTIEELGYDFSSGSR